MITSLKELRQAIRECINEYGAPTGKLRKPGSRASGKTQYKIGWVQDENEELSSYTANQRYPGSVDIWCEVVSEIAPEFPFKDDFSIRKHSLFFRIGNQLRVALDTDPQHELATWNQDAQDWFEL